MPLTCRVPMRDGIELAADVYLPEGPGPHPVVIIRTPYGKRQFTEMGAALTAHGYAFFAQDVRGTFDSPGTFQLYPQEPPDAVDTGRWILAQPWCDGRLGVFGLSYCAGATIAIATEFPERVKACIWVTVPVARDLLSWQGGAVRLHHALPWSVLLKEGKLTPRDWQAFYRTLPLAVAAPDAPVWQMLCQHEDPADPFWTAMDMTPYLDRVRAPGLHAGGWYDFVLDSTLVPYARMARVSGAPQRLLVGPWSHNAILSAPEFRQEMAAWLDRWFEGAPAPQTEGVRVYLTGKGAGWRDLPAWPDPDAPTVTLFLAPDHRLTPTPPDGNRTDSFISDPHDPVPTQGGAVWEFSPAGLDPGPALQTTAIRPDVLTYDTEPLTAPLAICGKVRAHLEASVSTADADFAVKLCDVSPDGGATYICDGILRGRFHAGLDHPALLTTNRVYDFAVTMDCGHVLAPGHRLRLEVAGSNFPKFDRNLHTGGSQLHSGPDEAVTAVQTIHLGHSRLRLPVLQAG